MKKKYRVTSKQSRGCSGPNKTHLSCFPFHSNCLMHGAIRRTLNAHLFPDSNLLFDFLFSFPTADENDDLNPPVPNEIKEGQWLGVTVSSQRPSGVVSVI